jgi:hypothetical protein
MVPLASIGDVGIFATRARVTLLEFVKGVLVMRALDIITPGFPLRAMLLYAGDPIVVDTPFPFPLMSPHDCMLLLAVVEVALTELNVNESDCASNQ